MNPLLRPSVSALFLTSTLLAQVIPDAPYQCVTLRSSGQDGITCISAFAPLMPLRPAPFTPADFAAACSGTPAYEVLPASSWCPSLVADPAARWISTTPSSTAVSAMYCQSFQVPACGAQSASIRFSFCVDDWIGDPPNDPNPVGVYLNGQPVPGFSGFGSQVTWSSSAIAPLLVPGTNQLQVYVRDTGASVAGVIYSATVCWVGCRRDEVIRLRSGNGALGGADTVINYLAGAPASALSMTPANFAAAMNGPSAQIVAPGLAWCPSLTVDPQAQWIAMTPTASPGSALYSHQFAVSSCNLLSATLSFSCSVDSWLGDPSGPAVGLFVNQNPVPLSVVDGVGGTACNLNVTASIPPAWLYGNAFNTLQVYVRDTGSMQNGILYSATLTVQPCAPGSQVIDLRSGNGSLGGSDAAIRFVAGNGSQPLSNAPFTAADFAAAATGPAAFIGSNFQWCQTLPQDPQAKWVSTNALLGPRSTLFAHPFTLNLCPADIKRAQLVLRYCADDGLGDPTGGPNPMGLYLNGIPIPGTAGDITTWPGTNVKTITTGNIAPFLLSGNNVLYLYDRDRNDGISGVLYSARITVSPCDWYYYGDSCGQTVPDTWLTAAPTLGNPVGYRVRGNSIAHPQPAVALVLIGLSDTVGPGGLPLPLDLGAFGAPGCRLLTSVELSFFVITDANGNADINFGLPANPMFDGLPLNFQTVVLDGVSNPLGLSATRGIAVDIRM